MNALAHRSRLVSGIFVTIAALCSGCAGGLAANHTPMAVVDLDTFVIDCKMKHQQVAMLQNMRQSPDEIFRSQTKNAFTPWGVFTAPRTHALNQDIGSGQINWMINQHLIKLRDQCS